MGNRTEMIDDTKIIAQFFLDTRGIFASALLINHNDEFLKQCIETIVRMGTKTLEEVKHQKENQ